MSSFESNDKSQPMGDAAERVRNSLRLTHDKVHAALNSQNNELGKLRAQNDEATSQFRAHYNERFNQIDDLGGHDLDAYNKGLSAAKKDTKDRLKNVFRVFKRENSREKMLDVAQQIAPLMSQAESIAFEHASRSADYQQMKTILHNIVVSTYKSAQQEENYKLGQALFGGESMTAEALADRAQVMNNVKHRELEHLFAFPSSMEAYQNKIQEIAKSLVEYSAEYDAAQADALHTAEKKLIAVAEKLGIMPDIIKDVYDRSSDDNVLPLAYALREGVMMGLMSAGNIIGAYQLQLTPKDLSINESGYIRLANAVHKVQLPKIDFVEQAIEALYKITIPTRSTRETKAWDRDLIDDWKLRTKQGLLLGESGLRL